MCENASQPASNLIAEARGVLDRNRGRWPEADWQTLDRFVRLATELVDCADQLIDDEPDPRIIETVEQLDTLPVGAVVIDDMSDVLQRFNADGGWLMLGYDGLHLPVLPARVLSMSWEFDR